VTGPLKERYGIEATMANDGNCVALAEAWIGAAKGKRDVLCVVLGTGVGGGIISGGNLIEGARGFGGEIGHFPTHAEKKPAYKGDLSADYEKHAATSALVNLAAEAGAPWTNGREVFNAAAAGDEKALAVLDEWIYEIAMGITGLVHVFDPETVIIGGGVSAQEDLLIRPLREKILDLVQTDFADGLEIKAAELGNNAGMAGAVKYFIDSMARKES
jgi:glucokinase